MFNSVTFAVIASCLTFASATKSTEMGDMYVFAYSWQPEFCHGQTTYPGCDEPQDFWNTDFTMHGLWPQFQAGGYPDSCTTEAFNSTVTDDIGMDTMTKYWPNVKEAEDSADYDEFWEHEWEKHGTCSGLTQSEYFNTAINMLKELGTPASYTAAVGSTIDAQELRDSYGGSKMCTLSCSSSKYITDLYTCWTRDATTGMPGSQMECPTDVQQEDTCTVTTLEVASF